MYTQAVYCTHKDANTVIKDALYPNHFIAHLTNTQNVFFCEDHAFSSLDLLQFHSRMRFKQNKSCVLCSPLVCFYLDKTSIYFPISYRTGDIIKLSHVLIWNRFLDPLLQRKGANYFELYVILNRGYFCPPDRVKHSYIDTVGAPLFEAFLISKSVILVYF